MEHRVVVTGMGAVTPVGNSATETWDAFIAGKNGIGAITRFDTTDFKVKVAGEVKDLDCAERLGCNTRHMDLFVQYALVAADEAIAQAGLDAEGSCDRDRVGVYVGSGIGGMKSYTDNVDVMRARGARRVSPFMIPMMIANMAAGEIAIRQKLYGPTLPVVTACATSAHTIGEAFRAIKHGYADAIVAGGSEGALVPEAVAGFTNAKALTKNPDPETACRPFDAGRDGFVMGEGAGIVVLEEEMRACCDHLYMMTDDGTYGEKGFTTVKLKELLEKAKAEGKQYDHCICIGPLPMMKFVCQITKEYGVATMVDMNCIMIDGSGMCGGCRLTVDGKMKFTCVDGPEFDGHLVDFDEAIARSKIYEAQEQKVFERRHHYCNLQAMADAEEAAQKKEEK